MAGLMLLEKYAGDDQVTDMRGRHRPVLRRLPELIQIEAVAKDMMAALPGEDSETAEGVDVTSEEEAAEPYAPGRPDRGLTGRFYSSSNWARVPFCPVNSALALCSRLRPVSMALPAAWPALNSAHATG